MDPDQTARSVFIVFISMIQLVSNLNIGSGCNKQITFARQKNISKMRVNPYKPSVLFVGHRKTVKTQIRSHHLIRVSTVCLQNDLLKFE